jgi:membrane-associated phospholipid phosphatase
MDTILELDKKIFHLINHAGSNAFFDAVLPWTRVANTWLPLYLFVIVFVTVNYGKRGWLWVLFAIITVGLANTISSDLIKENIFRLRPCRDVLMNGQVHFRTVYCPVSSSFTSSHAVNHFAMAMFIYLTGRRQIGPWLGLFFAWAFIIIYAQVYVGVHYPFDVLCGAVVGLLIGWVTGLVFNRRIGLVKA